MNPVNWLLRIWVLNPFAVLPVTWSGGRRHFKAKWFGPVSSPEQIWLCFRPCKLSVLTVGQLEGTWPELFCHG